MPAHLSAGELESFIHEKIPVSRLMGVRVESSGSGHLVLTAPLDVNHNHLGTAFGGSLATVATLAGYAALWMALEDREAHIVIRRSSLEYKLPVRGEIRALCEIPNGKPAGTFRKTFERHEKARMNLTVAIVEDGRECVTFSGDFVALRGL